MTKLSMKEHIERYTRKQTLKKLLVFLIQSGELDAWLDRLTGTKRKHTHIRTYPAYPQNSEEGEQHEPQEKAVIPDFLCRLVKQLTREILASDECKELINQIISNRRRNKLLITLPGAVMI